MEKKSKMKGGRDAMHIEETIDIYDYLRMVIRHRWVFLTVFSLIFLAGLLYCLAATPIYQATVGIIIDKEETDPGALQAAVFSDTSGVEYYQTMYKILESRSVAYNVIERLKLAENVDFFRRAVRNKTDNASAQASPKDALIGTFLANLNIMPVKNSHYVNICYQSKNPELAAAIANAMVEAYREHAFAMKLDSIQNSAQWLNDNMAQERKKVEDAERALLNFREKNNIVMDFCQFIDDINRVDPEAGRFCGEAYCRVNAYPHRLSPETILYNASSKAILLFSKSYIRASSRALFLKADR